MKINIPIIVEGKYDKIKLSSIFDAKIIATDGFGIFSHKEKLEFIRKLSKNGKIIVATDSDHAGQMIRNYLKNCLDDTNIINIYIPQISGKEKRKKAPSKEGFLGVEGTQKDILVKLFAPYIEGSEEKNPSYLDITVGDFYEMGLCGRDNSAQYRKQLAINLDLPTTLSTKALIDAINTLCTEEEFILAVQKAINTEISEK